jgi:hypothetical protein
MSERQAMVGDRVELVRCTDQYTRLEPGSRGTVRLVDSTGTVHVDWDSGSTLGLIKGYDAYRVVGFAPSGGFDLTDLRVGDSARVLRIAAGGGPRSDADSFAVYCPLCGCNKSGYASEPNGRTEACENGACACHDEEAT